MAADLRTRADVMEKSVDTVALASVAESAREANAVIDRRTFSWTELLNQFQATSARFSGRGATGISLRSPS